MPGDIDGVSSSTNYFKDLLYRVVSAAFHASQHNQLTLMELPVSMEYDESVYSHFTIRREHHLIREDRTWQAFHDMIPHEMAELDGFAQREPDERPFLNTLVGNRFGMERLGSEDLVRIFITHILELLSDSGLEISSDAAFDVAYEYLDRELIKGATKYETFVPLSGLSIQIDALQLPDGLVVRRMDPVEVTRAIRGNALQTFTMGIPQFMQVREVDRYALFHEIELPFIYESRPGTPLPTIPNVEEKADQLVTALRLICGGSVLATRQIQFTRPGRYIRFGGQSFSTRLHGRTAEDRPCILSGNDAGRVASIYSACDVKRLERDKMAVPIRRFRDSSSRLSAEDELLDLVIATEAMFGDGKPDALKYKLALRMAMHLNELSPSAYRVKSLWDFVRDCYDARSAIVHGGKKERNAKKTALYTLPEGTQTSELSEVVRRFADLVRESALSFVEADSPFAEGGIADWDRRMAARLDLFLPLSPANEPLVVEDERRSDER